MTTTLKFAEARLKFGHILNLVEYGNKRVIVARHQRQSAAIVSVADLARLQAIEDAEAKSR